MTFLAILGMIAAGLTISLIGVGIWRRLGWRSRAPARSGMNSSSNELKFAFQKKWRENPSTFSLPGEYLCMEGRWNLKTWR